MQPIFPFDEVGAWACGIPGPVGFPNLRFAIGGGGGGLDGERRKKEECMGD